MGSSIGKVERANGLRRVLGFKELFFASLGGQSPFLSIMTYGTAIILYVGLMAPLAALIGTLIVLVNGMVVYQLSRRITKAGGYYSYANHLISPRIGLETGFIYLFYSTLYGSAYAIGAAGLVWFLFHINYMYALVAILVVQFILAALGIRPSAKYAIFAGSLELAMLITIGLILLYLSGFRISPQFIVDHGEVNLTALGYASLLAAAIPTGYGTITPLSGETKVANRNVPRAIVSVILAGGLLAAFDLMAFNSAGIALFRDYGEFESMIRHLIGLNTFSSPILYLLHSYFGIFVDVPVIIALINDGILGVLAYALASSRVLYAMSLDGWLPRQLSIVNVSNNNPTLASLASSAAITMVSIMASLALKPFMAFVVLGGLSTMAGMIIHVVSDVSLAKLGALAKRRLKKVGLISLSVTALGLASYLVVSTMISVNPVYIEVFLAWLLLGFIYAEALAIIKGTR